MPDWAPAVLVIVLGAVTLMRGLFSYKSRDRMERVVAWIEISVGAPVALSGIFLLGVWVGRLTSV